MTATPWGFRDILPEEAQAREEIALTVKGCFREHHYLPVETPLLEDKGSLEEGGRIADTPFKLFDDDGRLLVVRPDNTLPIVRLVSTRMRAADRSGQWATRNMRSNDWPPRRAWSSRIAAPMEWARAKQGPGMSGSTTSRSSASMSS